jgi:uncharacterized protein YcfL
MQRGLGVFALGVLLAVTNGCCSLNQAANRLEIHAKSGARSKETPNCGLDEMASIKGGRTVFSGEQLQCAVDIESLENDKRLDLEYKFEWYDAASMLLTSSAQWLPFFLDAGAQKTLQSAAPSPGAEKVVFSMRLIKALGARK